MFDERYSPHALALLRIILGAMFALHGSQKVLGWPPPEKLSQLPPFILFGGWIELIGGIMITIGLLTTVAAFICSGEMAVAYFMYHAPGGFLPTQNKGELAVVYCFVFLFIAMRGAGPWSIDSLIRNRK